MLELTPVTPLDDIVDVDTAVGPFVGGLSIASVVPPVGIVVIAVVFVVVVVSTTEGEDGSGMVIGVGTGRVVLTVPVVTGVDLGVGVKVLVDVGAKVLVDVGTCVVVDDVLAGAHGVGLTSQVHAAGADAQSYTSRLKIAPDSYVLTRQFCDMSLPETTSVEKRNQRGKANHEVLNEAFQGWGMAPVN
jgi:hypothetical protein